jgi:cyclic pyranopterin phosphate synthase
MLMAKLTQRLAGVRAGCQSGCAGRTPTVLSARASTTCLDPRGEQAANNEELRMSQLSHFDEHGASRMVDTSQKPETLREARASGRVRMAASTGRLIRDRSLAKGDVLEVARLAGIMAAKRTGELIPLCHPLPLTAVAVDFRFEADDLLSIEATARVFGRTGVEIEALTAVSVAALTVYDMCKAIDRTMTLERVRLEEKSGGRSGTFHRAD